MTAPVAIAVESVEIIDPYVVYTSGNLAYVGISHDFFFFAALTGKFGPLLRDAYESTHKYAAYDRVLFIPPEQAEVARRVRLPFEQAGFLNVYLLVPETTSVSQTSGS